MKMRARIFLWLIGVALCRITHSQGLPFQNLEIRSPEVAAMDKFTEIPVSHHTGIPDINIPLYTIKEGSITVPISLRYHAGGLKVMETASWVGAGWSLEAGGVISREVRGAPDEDQDFGSSSFIEERGHYSHFGPNSYVTAENQAGNDYINYQGFSTGLLDGEPDIYRFTMPGHSGKFYFDASREPVLMMGADYKIDVDRSATSGFYNWIITVPDGTRFYFGTKFNQDGTQGSEIIADKTYSVKIEGGTSSNYTSISGWFLTKIESADGRDFIVYDYSEEKYGYYTLQTTPNNNEGVVTGVKNSYEGWELANIHFSSGSVEFVANDIRQDLSAYSGHPGWGYEDGESNATELDAILIKDNAGDCNRKFSLSQSYYEDEGTYSYFSSVTTDRKRLKLDKVQEVSCDGIDAKGAYEFHYYSPELVPRRLSYAQDHWGYYNGKRENVSLFPRNDSRETSSADMIAGTLESIVYPTGGTVSFKYDANKVRKLYSITEPGSIVGSLSGSGELADHSKDITIGSGTYRIELTASAYEGDPYAVVQIPKVSHPISDDDWIINQSIFPSGSPYVYEKYISAGTYTLKLRTTHARMSASITLRKNTTTHVNKLVDVGGLRVSEIVTSSGYSDDKVVKYTYSDGVLYGRPVYKTLVRNDIYKEYGYRKSDGTLDYTLYGCADRTNPQVNVLGSPSSVFALNHAGGYHIGYDIVNETEEGIGHTEYMYDTGLSGDPYRGLPGVAQVRVPTRNCNLSVPNYPPAPKNEIAGRGDLISKTYYDNGHNPVYRKTYDYVYEEYDQEEGFICSSFMGNRSTRYTLKAYRLLQKTTTTKKYDAESGEDVQIIKVEDFAEGNRFGLKSIEERTEVAGETSTSKTAYKYPQDFITGFERDAGTPNYDCDLYDYSSEELSSAEWFQKRKQYDLCICEANGDFAVKKYNVRTNYENDLSHAFSNATEEYKALLALRLGNQQVPVEISNWKDSRFIGSTFLTYETGSTIGSVYPKQAYAFETVRPLDASRFQESKIVSGQVVKDADYSKDPVLTYKFSDGRLSHANDRSELSTLYRWGYNNQYVVLKAEVASGNLDLAVAQSLPFGYSNLEMLVASLNGITSQQGLKDIWKTFNQNLRRHQETMQMMVYTFTYDPLFGMTSQTDPGGLTTYYEYDSFGRLSQVKDHEGNILKEYTYNYKD